MREGWECPKCLRIYAPYVSECQICNSHIPSMSDDPIGAAPHEFVLLAPKVSEIADALKATRDDDMPLP